MWWFIECKSIPINFCKVLRLYATSIKSFKSAKSFKYVGVAFNKSWLHDLGLLTQ